MSLHVTNIEEPVFDMRSSKNPEVGNNFIPGLLILACADDPEEETWDEWWEDDKMTKRQVYWPSAINKISRSETCLGKWQQSPQVPMGSQSNMIKSFSLLTLVDTACSYINPKVLIAKWAVVMKLHKISGLTNLWRVAIDLVKQLGAMRSISIRVIIVQV